MKKLFNKISCLTIIFLFIINNYSYAQISEGGIPPSFKEKHSKFVLKSATPKVPVYNVPIAFDVKRLIWEDEQVDKNGGSNRIAINIQIADSSVNIKSSGVWEVLDDSTYIWRQIIKAKDAQGIILSYKDFYIPKGGQLFIYNNDLSKILGAYTNKTNPTGGGFATELISGDEITLEYVKSNQSDDKPRIVVDEIGYAYNLFSFKESNILSTRAASLSNNCFININCADGRLWQKQKRGVVRLLINKDVYWFNCSGSLINNTVQDGTPYLLTASHCFGSDVNYNRVISYFNYEYPSCSNGSGEPTSTKTLIGAKNIVDTPLNGGGDGVLLLLKNEIPLDWYPYFNGWNRTNIPAKKGVVIHHPYLESIGLKSVKKITTYVSPLTSISYGPDSDKNVSAPNAHWRVVYDGRSVTKGGSSGSPIFNQDGLIVGSLTGGSSDCIYPYSPDSFAKLWYNWDQYETASDKSQKMSIYLDPLNTGKTILEGFDPNPPTGIEEEIIKRENKEISIFPNPVLNDLNINTDDIIRSLSIFDMRGKLVYSKSNYNSSTFSLSIGDWMSGVYTVVLNVADKKVTEKFSKK